MVHGSCVSIGCYAMTDDGIEEIFAIADAAFRNDQKFFRVHIFPFSLKLRNIDSAKKHYNLSNSKLLNKKMRVIYKKEV